MKIVGESRLKKSDRPLPMSHHIHIEVLLHFLRSQRKNTCTSELFRWICNWVYCVFHPNNSEKRRKKKLYTARNEIYLSTIFIDSFSYSLAKECFGACEDSTFSVRYTSVSYVCVCARHKHKEQSRRTWVRLITFRVVFAEKTRKKTPTQYKMSASRLL